MSAPSGSVSFPYAQLLGGIPENLQRGSRTRIAYT